MSDKEALRIELNTTSETIRLDLNNKLRSAQTATIFYSLVNGGLVPAMLYTADAYGTAATADTKDFLPIVAGVTVGLASQMVCFLQMVAKASESSHRAEQAEETAKELGFTVQGHWPTKHVK